VVATPKVPEVVRRHLNRDCRAVDHCFGRGWWKTGAADIAGRVFQPHGEHGSDNRARHAIANTGAAHAHGHAGPNGRSNGRSNARPHPHSSANPNSRDRVLRPRG